MESINGSDIVKSNLPTGITAILFSGYAFSVIVILLTSITSGGIAAQFNRTLTRSVNANP
jgi:hypothetical protein